MTLASPRWLLVPYVVNILILVPVCYRMMSGDGTLTVFAGLVPESTGLRLMVGSLWSAILLASIAGLAWPAFFAPVVLTQVVYKSLWLALFILPLLRVGQPVPSGIAVTFLLIVLSYPVFYGLALRE